MSLFSVHVSLPYNMTGNTSSLCAFLFTFILAFLFFLVFDTLLNAAHLSAMRLLISGRKSPTCVTVLHVSLYLFNNISVYGDSGRDGIFIEHHLGLSHVHDEAYWFAGVVYVSEHALQLLWRLIYQDVIIGRDHV